MISQEPLIGFFYFFLHEGTNPYHHSQFLRIFSRKLWLPRFGAGGGSKMTQNDHFLHFFPNILSFYHRILFKISELVELIIMNELYALGYPGKLIFRGFGT